MRHRIADDRPEIDPTGQDYWSQPGKPMGGSGPHHITWTHPQLVEEHMLAMRRANLANMILPIMTWLTRLPIVAVVSAPRRFASRGEVSAS